MNIRDSYLQKVAEITVPFLNNPEDSNAVAEQFIKTFAIKDVKGIAMVRLMYHHLQQIVRLSTEENQEYIDCIIGLDTNVLVDIAMDEWDDLANRLA